MRLWHLLIGICFGATVGSALAAARVAEAGIGGYTLAMVTGLAVGASCGWLMWRLHKVLVPKLLLRVEKTDSLSEWYGRAFYISKVLWIVLAGLLGFWLSSALLRTVFSGRHP